MLEREVIESLMVVCRHNIENCEKKMIEFNKKPFTAETKDAYDKVVKFRREGLDFLAELQAQLPPPMTERAKAIALSVAKLLNKMSPDQFFMVMDNCEHMERIG